MSMALSAFGRILLVSNACAVELLVCIGVCVCGWPNSSSVVHMEMAVFALMNRFYYLQDVEDSVVIDWDLIVSCHEHVVTCSASRFQF